MSNQYPHVQVTRRTRLTLVVLLSIAALIATEGILSRMHADKILVQASQTADIMSVNVVTPQQTAATRTLTLPCNVMPYYEAQIFSRVNGYLKMWYTDYGAHVKKGQLLATVETPDLDQEIQRARSDLETVDARLELAVVTAKRWQNLLATDSVSRQEVDEKVDGAKAQQAEVDAAQAHLRTLLAEQSFNRIVAPFDGIITDRNTDIGMLITVGSGSSLSPMFKIADEHKLRVYADVPQNFADQINPNITAVLHFPDRPHSVFPAKYVTTAKSIQMSSRTLVVELMLDNPTGELNPGSYADVEFTLQNSGNALTIPASTLLFRKGGLKVATVGPDNRVVLKPVKLGRDLGKLVEVEDGITVNDKIINLPSDSIAAGDRVRIVDGK